MTFNINFIITQNYMCKKHSTSTQILQEFVKDKSEECKEIVTEKF